jgi:misacylated tRNA(Ala) deacylase
VLSAGLAVDRFVVFGDIRYSWPMGENLCYRDAYVREIHAVVQAVQPPLAPQRGPLVLLDRTIFYPGGGGQPADQGFLEGANRRWIVRTATRWDGETAHELEPGAEPPAEGTPVRAVIDWERRYLLMRTHTALHALCGVVWRDYGALVTGGNMEPGAGRMDFEFERLTGDLVGEIEAKVNEELARGREVRVNVLPREVAFSIPDLIRTKVNLLPEGITEVRTIEIVGLDLQADGGTHVANTREVGQIRVTGYESKGRINKRIRIALVDR